MTDNQIKALELGLKFAPTPTDIPDPLEIFERFQQRCSWAFRRVTRSSCSQLPTEIQERLEVMKEKLSSLQQPEPEHTSNISIGIRQGIQQLKSNHALTIREADKGSCIVVMDTCKYIEEGLHHLTDQTIYKEVDHDRTLEVAHKANWAARHHHSTGKLSATLFKKLTTDLSEVRTQELYFMRKVHKHPHQIRPIVSCSSGPTEKLSGYLCSLLTPHLDQAPSLIKNSQQVVRMLENLDLSTNSDITLVILDVKSLYLSIPQGPAIEMVLQRIIPTHPPTSKQNDFKNMARDLLKVVIKDNTFRFNNRFYDQVRGVAMGTKCAPPFANLFLAVLEERALESWKGPPPKLWLRFLDDILMLWTGNQQLLLEFMAHLNNQMSSIKFTHQQSQECITFLDLQIHKGSRFRKSAKLDLKLHIKGINPQNFLHFSSCHPSNTFTTIIKGEILRALRCTSDSETFSEIVDQLHARFMARGYPNSLFWPVADSIDYNMRDHYLMPHPRRELLPETTIFSATYHPALNSSDIWNILMDDQTPFSPMVVRPRPKSHGDLLVRARTRSQHKNTPATTSSPASEQPPFTS